MSKVTLSKPAHEPGSTQVNSRLTIGATTPAPQSLQRKLTVNTPGDKYEQEADRVAEHVMRMPLEDTAISRCSRRSNETLQRKSAPISTELNDAPKGKTSLDRALGWVRANAKLINESATKAGVPPSFVAGVICWEAVHNQQSAMRSKFTQTSAGPGKPHLYHHLGGRLNPANLIAQDEDTWTKAIEDEGLMPASDSIDKRRERLLTTGGSVETIAAIGALISSKSKQHGFGVIDDPAILGNVYHGKYPSTWDSHLANKKKVKSSEQVSWQLSGDSEEKAIDQFIRNKQGIIDAALGLPETPTQQHGIPTQNRPVMRSSNAVGPVVAPLIVSSVLSSAGSPLPTQARTFMESRFGQDFSHVRVHTDSQAQASAQEVSARAYTVGHNIVFGKGEHPSSDPRLLAHELTHVCQQTSVATDTLTSPPAIQRDVGWGQRDGVIPDPYGMGYNTILKNAGTEAAVRDLVSLEQPDLLTPNLAAFWILPSSRAAAIISLEIHSKGTGCEVWFEKLHGSKSAKKEEAKAVVNDPYGGPSPVTTYFIPGKTNRIAMVIGGVHEKTEGQGAIVVNGLLDILRADLAAGRPPYFTVVLVPKLFDKSRYSKKHSRWIEGGIGKEVDGAINSDRPIEPNRNFPLPGEGLGDAKARGASSPTSPELVFNDPRSKSAVPAQDGKGEAYSGTSIRMLQENRVLIALIEHFQPERVATVHAHSYRKEDLDKKTGKKNWKNITTQGDAPGIFVDPRGIDPKSGAIVNASEVQSDDRLANAMVLEGNRRWSAITGPSDPFVGNAAKAGQPANVRYTSGIHAEGNSFGTWAPVPVMSGPSARLGIATVTIEVPQWKDKADAVSLAAIEKLHSELLTQIFLEDPNVVAPAGQTKAP